MCGEEKEKDLREESRFLDIIVWVTFVKLFVAKVFKIMQGALHLIYFTVQPIIS